MGALAREQGIVKIFPHVRVLLQIDDRSRLLAATIHEKLYSAHVVKIGTASRDVKSRVGRRNNALAVNNTAGVIAALMD